MSKSSKNNSVILEDKIQDECGLYAVYCSEINENSKYDVYYGLYALQHRGQDSAGIAYSQYNNLDCYKDKGLVSKVFTDRVMTRMPVGDVFLGHVRAAVGKDNSPVKAQPMLFKGRFGKFAVAMNGKITNSNKLAKQLREQGALFQTYTDVEIISTLINKYSKSDNIVYGILDAVKLLEGSFAFCIITIDKVIAVRDRFGIRPLALGKKFDDYYISSESCAFDATEVELVRDIKPGEILEISSEGLKSYFMDDIERKPCIFEYVYTARPDSIIDNKSVYQARYSCGYKLAKKLKIKADIVAGVPDSAVVAARGYAAGSNIPYIDVLEKNRYVGRTFIQPMQYMRENSVRIKLNVHSANIKDKDIILIDDSIVRGTTSKKLIDMIRKFGAKKIHVVIASPVVKHPCYTGVDIEDRDELVGSKYSVEQIREKIGADSLNYMSVNDLVSCCKTNEDDEFCCACFDGNYPDNIEEKILREEGIYGNRL